MADSKTKTEPAEKPKGPSDPILANRETVESIVVAVILALLFRAFVAEAFVIPTGSMAPTLMGRHVDVWCDECEYHYTASASVERSSSDDSLTKHVVVDARCPNCGFRKPLDRSFWSNENSFSGDRIIVSKFAYELGSPQRFDVIVFKNPQQAQQNFIKRLIGLPNEEITLEGGNIYVRGKDDDQGQIARKPDDKLLALLQIVHDSDHPAPQLQQAGWPAWWQPHGNEDAWKPDESLTSYALSAVTGDALLRYHHVDPVSNDTPDGWYRNPADPDGEKFKDESHWGAALRGDSLEITDWRGGLISDFYAYNSSRSIYTEQPDSPPGFREGSSGHGHYWVDDLAVECEVELAEATGEILLDLVRAGNHYTCRIDTKTGQATLQARTAAGEAIPFGAGESQTESVAATTSVKGPGTYRLRMSNVDHELRLWVNSWRVAFAGPTSYDSERLVLPDVDSPDGDLAPVGVGGNNQALTVRHLKVLRDKYYIAGAGTDEYGGRFNDSMIARVLANPVRAEVYNMLSRRQSESYQMGDDQFFPLGDNSPASSDARYWREPFVDRRLLVGRAIFIYWPHSWNMPPFFPNFRKMQPIR